MTKKNAFVIVPRLHRSKASGFPRNSKELEESLLQETRSARCFPMPTGILLQDRLTVSRISQVKKISSLTFRRVKVLAVKFCEACSMNFTVLSLQCEA